MAVGRWEEESERNEQLKRYAYKWKQMKERERTTAERAEGRRSEGPGGRWRYRGIHWRTGGDRKTCRKRGAALRGAAVIPRKKELQALVSSLLMNFNKNPPLKLSACICSRVQKRKEKKERAFLPTAEATMEATHIAQLAQFFLLFSFSYRRFLFS